MQYDGFGAGNASQFSDIITSRSFIRGDMQTLGGWNIASQIAYQIHPLVSLNRLAPINVLVRSVLASPGLTWSTTGSLTVTAAAFRGLGTEPVSPASEECIILLVEPQGVVNTGNTGGDLTAENDVWV